MPRRKDRLERLIREIVCSGQLDTAMAQEAFAKDWIAAYQRYYQKAVSLPAHTLCDSVSQAMGVISRLGSKPASAIVNQKPGYDRARYSRATIFEAIPGRRSASHILNRVREAQFPDRLDGNDWRYGTDLGLHEGARRLLGERVRLAQSRNESRIGVSAIRARVNDYDIHFYHVKGRGPKPMPLVLTYGWPENETG